MAAEAAVLGTPALRVSSFANRLDVFEELERRYGIVKSYHPKDMASFFNHLDNLLGDNRLIDQMKEAHEQLLKDKCNVADCLFGLLRRNGKIKRSKRLVDVRNCRYCPKRQPGYKTGAY